MKNRALVIIITLSLVLGLVFPLSTSAAEESYDKEKDKTDISSEVMIPNESAVSLNDIAILTGSVLHHSEEKTIVPKAVQNFVESNNSIENEYVIATDIPYDYVTATFLSTNGVTLNSKSFQRTLENDEPISISFTPLNPFIDK